MIRRVGVAACAVLALAGCSGSDDVDAGSAPVADGGDADEAVAAAVNAVLGDESFRSQTSGETPFVGAVLEGIYEQSGESLIDVSSSGSIGSATVIIGDTAYEWNVVEQSWMETPLDSFDPLIYPGFGFMLGLVGVFDDADEPSDVSDMPAVATGWTEVDATGGTRRFERPLPTSFLTGSVVESDDVPVERLEEAAITEEFVEHATLTTIVDLDADGNLTRYTVRSEYEGSADFPQCAPLQRVTGTTEQVVEFRDVGVEFTISVPSPAELVARFPVLGEQVDVFDDAAMNSIDAPFRNEAGERDLTGCPTP